MKLSTYLTRNNLSASDFARRLGVTRAAVSLWTLRQRRPRPHMVAAIEAATDGAVKRRDLRRTGG